MDTNNSVWLNLRARLIEVMVPKYLMTCITIRRFVRLKRKKNNKQTTNPNRNFPPSYNHLLEAMNFVLKLLYLFIIGYQCVGRKVGDFRNADIRFKKKAGNDLFWYTIHWQLLVRSFIYWLALSLCEWFSHLSTFNWNSQSGIDFI